MFAHRHLAELLLEHYPWRAALHLREVVRADPRDDIAHALLGLCHTLLENYWAAVTAYRRALQVAPRNPWYHHNVGHLLDVALGRPKEAAPHLRQAHQFACMEHEITASLAHCLGGLGALEEAELLAREALVSAPKNRDHRELLKWILDGAPVDGGTEDEQDPVESESPGAVVRCADHQAQPCTPKRRIDAVSKVLTRKMAQSGLPAHLRKVALVLWNDYRASKQARIVKPEAYAAAVEYAIVCMHDIDHVTRASIAKRYGVAAHTVSNRYQDLRERLALRPHDPRYATV
ncbi:MAG: hypothetical protein H6715_04035 [Myxococcales bacterium]|nr:hypothetical protein [Myxococcales bacterium]